MSKGIARTNTLQEVQPPTWSTACSQPVCPFADNTLRTDIQVKTCWLHWYLPCLYISLFLQIVGFLPVNHPNNLLLPRNPRECPSTCTIFCDSHCGAMAGGEVLQGRFFDGKNGCNDEISCEKKAPPTQYKPKANCIFYHFQRLSIASPETQELGTFR